MPIAVGDYVHPASRPVLRGDAPIDAIYRGDAEYWRRKAFYRDDFADAANSALVPLFANPPASIANGRVNAGSVANNTGRQAASWCRHDAGLFLTDNYFVRAQLVDATKNATDMFTSLVLAVDTGFETASVTWTCSTRKGSLLVRSTGFPSGPGAAASGGQTQTVKATGPDITTSSLIEIQRTGATFVGLIDGAEAATFTDDSIQSGPGWRCWGICLEANKPLFQSQASSPSIEWIEAGDL